MPAYEIKFNRREQLSFWAVSISGLLAGRPGFEPGLHGPEPRVLPLNYLPNPDECVYIRNRKAGLAPFSVFGVF